MMLVRSEDGVAGPKADAVTTAWDSPIVTAKGDDGRQRDEMAVQTSGVTRCAVTAAPPSYIELNILNF